jgi:hypothetical protein
MTRTFLGLASLVGVGLGATLAVGQTKDAAPAPAKVRIGTYDNRAIAIAFVASRHNPVKEKTVAYERAKAAGDRDKARELQAWGERYQRQLYFQGFGHVPVADLLEPVKVRVRDLAQKRGLAAIGMACDYTAADVELVDITDDLVKLFDPSEKTLASARQARTVKPLDLVRLADLPAKP